MAVTDMFWEASIEDIKRGYSEDKDYYICLLCGDRIEKGVVYLSDDIFYEAEKYMQIHIEKEHKSVFEYLINQDKKTIGLSEHQSNLLKMFYEGKSDSEIQSELKIGSSSTIRNHRFVLREKERQAKVFLAIMELLKEGNKKNSKIVTPHKTAKMVDDRYKITESENEKIIKTYFTKGPNGPIKTFSMKEKSKIVVLREIIKRFEAGRTYSEKEVDEILEGVYEDYVTLRRYLIEYGFMDRKNDCSEYWINLREDSMEEKEVDRKKELIRQYKETKTEGGVYQIRNIQNQKVYITSTPNLKTINGAMGTLNGGLHKSKELQADWKKYGEDAFVFEVLEVLEEKEDGFFDKRDEIKKLEKKWLKKIQPYGDKGYNKEKI